MLGLSVMLMKRPFLLHKKKLYSLSPEQIIDPNITVAAITILHIQKGNRVSAVTNYLTQCVTHIGNHR